MKLVAGDTWWSVGMVSSDHGGNALQIVVVRGPLAVGKTSVCQELAKLIDPVAVIPVDWLRHMVGRWNPDNLREVILAATNAAALACNFVDAGYQVIIDGPFDHQLAVSALTAGLSGRKLFLVTLMAPWVEILRRHQSRPVNHRADIDRLTMVYDRIVENRADLPGILLDTAGKEPAEIAAQIAGMMQV